MSKHITIDGSEHGHPAKFEFDVITLLDTIETSRTGAAPLDELNWFRTLTIVPYDNREGQCNATGGKIIRFSPQAFRSPQAGGVCSKPNEAGSRPMEILFHELVHGVRDASGHMRTGKLEGLSEGYGAPWENEEFIAVMLTNIFLSEKGRTTRKDHKGYVAEAKSSSTLVSDAESTLIQRVKSQHPKMCERIASVKANYNPIRDHRKYLFW